MIILQVKKCYVLTKVELHNKLSLLILLYEKLFFKKKNIYIYKMMVKSKWKSMEKQLVQSNALMKKKMVGKKMLQNFCNKKKLKAFYYKAP